MLVFVFGFPLLKRIIQLAKAEKITSIADFLGARYGKSFAVASIATLIAVVGAVPYIALQLKAIAGSVSLMVEHYSGAPPCFDPFVSDISLIIAMLLALFAVLFGTRHADATEHQDGLVLAVAVESVVKLAAFLTVGILVTFFLFDSPQNLIDTLAANPDVQDSLGLPDIARHLAGADLAVGLRHHHAAAAVLRDDRRKPLRDRTEHRDLGVPALSGGDQPVRPADRPRRPGAGRPRHQQRPLRPVAAAAQRPRPARHGGFHRRPLGGDRHGDRRPASRCSIMISNDLVIPLFVQTAAQGRNPRERGLVDLILNIRRASIFIILFVAFLYYRESTNNARLASIGLMSFAAIAQFAPSFFGGLIWRRATAGVPRSAWPAGIAAGPIRCLSLARRAWHAGPLTGCSASRR